MPDKSVRDMSWLEKKRHSLAARMFHASALHSIILGALCFAIGFGMYLNAVMQDSMRDARDAAQASLAAVRAEADPAVYSARVMETVRALGGVEANTDAYYARFADIAEDAGYRRMLEILCARRTDSMSDFFFAVPDQAANAIFFVADTDPRPGHAYPVGKRRGVPGWLQRAFFNEKAGEFPHIYYYLPGRGAMCVSGAYIRDGDPEAGFLFVMIRAEDAVSGIRRLTLRYVLAVLIAILLMGWLFTRRMEKALVKPIKAIADAAGAYVLDRRDGVRDMEHFKRLNIRTGDELEDLSLVMAEMERSLTEYEADLTRITAEKEHMNTELTLAAHIQKDVLPNVYPAFPDRTEFDIYATMDPAREVGGDFYDYFLIDDDHLGMVIADVSGKGIPAALFMMASKILLGNMAMVGKSPAEALEAANNAICPQNREEMFITVWFGILEISTGRVTAANAGHEYPAVKQPDSPFTLLRDAHGFVIGSMEGMRYRNYELLLRPGAKLFVYTDGLPEATNVREQMYGTQRMIDALNTMPDAAPDKLLAGMRRAVDDFVGDAEQFDDLTMLCLEYRGKQEERGERQ